MNRRILSNVSHYLYFNVVFLSFSLQPHTSICDLFILFNQAKMIMCHIAVFLAFSKVRLKHTQHRLKWLSSEKNKERKTKILNEVAELLILENK